MSLLHVVVDIIEDKEVKRVVDVEIDSWDVNDTVTDWLGCDFPVQISIAPVDPAKAVNI